LRVRNTDVIALHSVYSFPVLAGYLLARLWRKPYVLWPHGVLSPFMRRIGRRKKWIYDKLIARRILKGASAVICTGEGERRETLALGLTDRTVVIPHGVSLKSFESLPERGRFRSQHLHGAQGPLILYLGRLAAVKNLELLIRAFARVSRSVPEARLALIGPPDPPSFETTVRNWLSEHGVATHTVVTGPITDLRLKQEALVDADLFVMPSHTENFCNALFEAMATGLPCVVSDCLNYAAEVADRGAGLAVPRDPELFAGAIVNLLSNPALRTKMGKNARELVTDYSWEKSGERLARTLGSILARRPLPKDLIGERPPELELAQ
jgi:glycosyltransferase involved in cell wall biosynthesis